MKKLILALVLSTFVAPIAITTYAASNGIKIELNDDDKKKKKKKKKGCCASETKSCGAGEQKACCSKKQN
jgi:hypothetical protein